MDGGLGGRKEGKKGGREGGRNLEGEREGRREGGRDTPLDQWQQIASSMWCCTGRVEGQIGCHPVSSLQRALLE